MFNNGLELTVHTGETFTIDYHFTNRDGSPYIIPKILNNPYFLVSVSDNRYREKSRYLINWWATCKYIPLFNSTVVLDVTDGNNDWDNIARPIELVTQNSYQFGEDVIQYYDDYLCSITVNGVTTYRFWSITDNGWKEYSCYIVKTFTNDITSEWKGNTYYYSITLLSGNLTYEDEVPIEDYDYVVPLVPPTSITVLTSINGDI